MRSGLFVFRRFDEVRRSMSTSSAVPSDGSPGRSCPVRYRYRPEAFAAARAVPVETAYVIGGLYGNPEALRAVLDMKRREEDHTGRAVTLVFNGDFNWFDVDADDFAGINTAVLEHLALQGNVEAELDGDEGGCGCNYPEHISQDVVDRSNTIMRRLQGTAKSFPELVRRLSALPMHLTLEVGGERVGVVHGDATSLSGWGFAAEAMAVPQASQEIESWFDRAGVLAFCSSHTGLPVLQRFRAAGRDRYVINNGAAGLPNFRGARYGLATRVSKWPAHPGQVLYGAQCEGFHLDALPVRYDHDAWLQRFARAWPPGSPAAESYAARLADGPDLLPEQAQRLSNGAA